MLKEKEWEKLNDLIAALYGIQSLTAMRTAFLRKLMLLIDFDLADFNLGQVMAKTAPALVDPISVSRFPAEKEEAFIRLYEEVYCKIDYVSWIFSHHESIVYRETDLINDQIRRESRFYKEYLAVFDLTNVAGISVISGGIFTGAVTIYRSEKKGDFSEKDLYILRMILPHLQNKLSISEESARKNKKYIRNTLLYNFHFTEKEIQILSGVYFGKSNAEIAERNQISLNTVKRHMTHLFQKAEVSSRTQLIRFLKENQLTEYWD